MSNVSRPVSAAIERALELLALAEAANAEGSNPIPHLETVAVQIETILNSLRAAPDPYADTGLRPGLNKALSMGNMRAIATVATARGEPLNMKPTDILPTEEAAHVR